LLLIRLESPILLDSWC